MRRAPTSTLPLRADSLATWRGDRRLFSGVSFDLSRGEILHVQGANGSGKTTLLRIICGLRPAGEGSLYWHDVPLPAAAPALREALAFVGHADGIKLDLSALQNVSVLAALRGGRPRLDAQEALSQAGLAAVTDVPGRALSAGQRRRLALSVLLTRHKPLWILDEPFTALDSAGVEFAAQLIDNHRASGGMVVFTSHHQLPPGLEPVRHLVLAG